MYGCSTHSLAWMLFPNLDTCCQLSQTHLRTTGERRTVLCSTLLCGCAFGCRHRRRACFRCDGKDWRSEKKRAAVFYCVRRLDGSQRQQQQQQKTSSSRKIQLWMMIVVIACSISSQWVFDSFFFFQTMHTYIYQAQQIVPLVSFFSSLMDGWMDEPVEKPEPIVTQFDFVCPPVLLCRRAFSIMDLMECV